MANVKKGQLTSSPRWWKHLRDYKGVFWGAERRAAKAEAEQQIHDANSSESEIPHRPSTKKKPKKRFGMEYRVREEHRRYDCDPSCAFLYEGQDEWKRWWGWYATATQRDRAMENLSKKPFLSKGPLYEYRPVER